MQVNRRSFLGAAGGAAFALGAVNASAARSAQPGFHLGVASYSLRKFPRSEAIKMIQRLGEKYVNIKSFHLPLESTPDEIRAARKEFEDAGLTIVGGGNIAFPKADEADIRAKFEYAKLAGMPLIVCAPTPETLPMMEKYVKEYDIKIAVHNHGPKDKFPSPLDALKLLKNMDPRCGVCVDVGHTAQAGVDVLKAIRASGPRLLDMHIKDMKVYGDESTLCDVGDGILPIPGIFRELEKLNYKACVNLEYEINGDDPLFGMARSFSYMHGVLAGMA
jgi:sugar phosphate isomerase/epimerase